MREEQDKRAMGIKEVEYRKLLKEQQIKEESKREGGTSKGQWQEQVQEESLFDRISRCMGKKICRLLEEERTRLPEEQKEEEYQKCRRDWEGQDNMMQFAGQD